MVSFTKKFSYKELSSISPTSNLYLHMNISSLSYHFDDVRYLVENCQNKPKAKVIGITEFRLRTNRTVLSSINLQDYTNKRPPTSSSKGEIYLDNKIT